MSGEEHRSSGATSLGRSELRGAAISGVRWVALARTGAEVVALASSVALARLIPPAEFGYAAVPMVLPMLSVVLTFEGFGAVLVQRERLDAGLAETAMLLSACSGLLLSAVVVLTVQLWAESLFGARSAELMLLAAPVFLVTGLGVVSRARLQRDLDFRRLSLIEVASVVSGALVALTLAVAGLNGEALVLGLVGGTTFSTVMLAASSRPPVPRLHRRCAGAILSFGVSASLASLSTVARRNIDYVVLSAQIGAAQVGLYWRAFQLGAEYQAKFSNLTQRLAFPLFSRTREMADARLVRSRVVRANVLVTFPLLALLIVVAPDLVPALYGDQWSGAVVPTQILATSGMALAVLSGTEQLVLSMGRPHAVLLFNFAFLVAVVCAILVAVPYGLVVIAAAVALAHVVMVVAGQAILAGRIVGIPARQLVGDVVPAAAASAALLACCTAAQPWINELGVPVSEIAASSLLGLAVYGIVLRRFFRPTWLEAVRTFKAVAFRGGKTLDPVPA